MQQREKEQARPSEPIRMCVFPVHREESTCSIQTKEIHSLQFTHYSTWIYAHHRSVECGVEVRSPAPVFVTEITIVVARKVSQTLADHQKHKKYIHHYPLATKN